MALPRCTTEISKAVAAPIAMAIIFFLAGCSTQFQLPASDTEALGQGFWCADFGELGTNCGFSTLEQCRATILGLSGQCYPSGERGVIDPQLARAR